MSDRDYRRMVDLIRASIPMGTELVGMSKSDVPIGQSRSAQFINLTFSDICGRGNVVLRTQPNLIMVPEPISDDDWGKLVVDMGMFQICAKRHIAVKVNAIVAVHMNPAIEVTIRRTATKRNVYTITGGDVTKQEREYLAHMRRCILGDIVDRVAGRRDRD